ncbi:hypothetical protein V2J09_014661 [Rumex salicifolius]
MAPPQPAASTASHGGGSNPMTLQFLSNVLSQRGPSALPYSEDVKWLIRQHLVSLSDAVPSLQPKTATFTHNDGRSVNLLQADGTVPMTYQGVTYNIPVVIWLMETYPRHPPCVYVNPTRDMIIKRPHQYVNPSGLVSIPYLQNWIYPSSNLVDLARNLGSYFSRDPPLYSQRVPRANPNPNPNFSAGGVSQVSSHPAMMNSGARPVIPPRGYPPSPYGDSGGRNFPPPPQTQRHLVATATEDPKEVFRRNAIEKLLEKTHADIAALRRTREAEMDTLFNFQQELRQRESQIDKGIREMQDEKETLEQQLQMVLTDCDVLEVWLSENRGKVGNAGSLDLDNVFEPCDVLSKQMMECSNSDLAIEDVIDALDRAVQNGVIPFDQYLKNIRLLSREQFFHRATAAKVRAAQMHAHVTNMAARAPQYGISLLSIPYCSEFDSHCLLNKLREDINLVSLVTNLEDELASFNFIDANRKTASKQQYGSQTR